MTQNQKKKTKVDISQIYIRDDLGHAWYLFVASETSTTFYPKLPKLSKL